MADNQVTMSFGQRIEEWFSSLYGELLSRGLLQVFQSIEDGGDDHGVNLRNLWGDSWEARDMDGLS